MAKSNLKGIARGLLGAFVSRNNDIHGYWGLGVLRGFAEANGLDLIQIDLFPKDAEAEVGAEVIESCKLRYRQWLETNLAKIGLSPEALMSAGIRLRFSNDFGDYPNAIRDTRGFPYECSVEIKRDASRSYLASKIGVCAPHDPQKESRRNHIFDH